LPYYFFIWTNEIEEHLAEHNVTREEFQQVVCDPIQVGKSRTGREKAFGYTDEGRRLVCIYEFLDDDQDTIIPVTAWQP